MRFSRLNLKLRLLFDLARTRIVTGHGLCECDLCDQRIMYGDLDHETQSGFTSA
jgi:hypothetical protein